MPVKSVWTTLGAAVGATALAVPAMVMPSGASAAAAYTPTITWGECTTPQPTGVECGTLDVPIDWSMSNDPRRAQIAIAVHRATKERRGTFTYNPGGPGTSGVGMLETWLTGFPYGPSAALPQRIRDHFDIVAWDPRGVGESSPQLVGCDATVTYGELPQAGPVDWTSVAHTYADSVSGALTVCQAANPDLAPYLGTSYVIQDLEALRQALAVAEWTYHGVSYGTTIGMAYARAYPDRIRALVLDGVAPPSQTQLQQAATMSWAWSYALRTFVGVYGAKLAHKVDRVVRALDAGPLTDPSGEPFPRFAQETLGLDSLVSSLWIQRGFESKRRLFAQLYQSAKTRGPVPQPVAPLPAQERMLPYVVSFVLCADRSDRPTPDQIAAIAETTAAAGLTAAGLQAIQRGLWCSGLPPIGIPVDASSTALRLTNSALVVNATGDPKTPWLRARLAASTIAGARLISYTGTQHGLFRRVGSTCIDGAVTRYLLTLQRPTADVSCPFTVAPAP